MKFVDVREDDRAIDILYTLLLERPAMSAISHAAMPTPEDHAQFVLNHPFRFWYLLETEGVVVGSLECTGRNEIGIAILKQYRRQGYAMNAMRLFLSTHKPLPAIAAVRNARWLANIAVGNEDSKRFFARACFTPIQETWAL